MIDRITSRLPKWPFLLADLVLLAVASAVVVKSDWPLGPWQMAVCFLAVVAGAWFSITPFLREYDGSVKLAEAYQLSDSIARLKDIEKIRAHIENATGQWQGVQDHSQRAVSAAGALADRMAAETKEFCSMLERINQAEKTHLKFEIDKLRRAEADWLQTVVRMLDNVFALSQAAAQSRQPALISQIRQFQQVSREIARRMGLNAFAPEGPQPFDPKAHQLPEESATVPEQAMISGVIAPGFTFQGRLMRKAVVVVQGASRAAAPAPVAAASPEPSPTAAQEVQNVSSAAASEEASGPAVEESVEPQAATASVKDPENQRELSL